MNPHIFEQMCKIAGAENFYLSIKNAMWSERMSEERKQLCSVRTMVVIYIMLYSQLQKCNSFQVALSRTLQQFGISNKGLESLRNLGIAAHPRTVKILTRSSSSHNSHVFTFIKAAIENNQFLIFCIDDYHNIHTHYRPEAKTQTQAIHIWLLCYSRLFLKLKQFHSMATMSFQHPLLKLRMLKIMLLAICPVYQKRMLKTCLIGFWQSISTQKLKDRDC